MNQTIKQEMSHENIIEVSGLAKNFGSIKAVDGVSFSVSEGELFGFLGINGAGKSTTINMLSTLYKPDRGKVSICGCDLIGEAAKIRKEISVVSQQNTLDDKLTIKENLEIRGGLYEKNSNKLKSRIREVVELLDLDTVYKRNFGRLSGGQKRKCEIAKALLNTPKLLFLDEPTTGLDPATRKILWDMLEKIRKEQKMTIFLTTHYMEEAARANHIAIIDKGKMMEYGTPFELKEKYAKDKLLLTPAHQLEAQNQLVTRGISYKLKNERISISIQNTIEALPIINLFENQITGFEVIQGTMDDVFLNVTGKALKEA